ncbi:hypothetical protein H4Q26_003585 [Puccinia striiformis f. sp. tritici PST-130]|nr:hypothetical protein Pst134EB_014576 [Puccinia striiformis f. sp. tritici]KAI9603976.1 hypothetical protein H4Q26_003585 [Puccinia striiformis f. sp. tritici PST-130]
MMSNYYEGGTGSVESLQTSSSTTGKELVEKEQDPAVLAIDASPVILGKHPRAEEVGEIDQITQDSRALIRVSNGRHKKPTTRNPTKNSRRKRPVKAQDPVSSQDFTNNHSVKDQEAAADLIEDKTDNWIYSLERRARKKFKSQDPQDKINTKKFRARVDQKFTEILKHMTTYSTETMKDRIVGSSITFVKGRKIKTTLDTYEVLIRLFNGDSVVPLRQTIEPRIRQILRGLNLYHNWLSLRNLDLHLTGKTNAYEDLLEWFWGILFEGTPERLPLIGWVAMRYPPKNPEEFFNSEAQKYLVGLLASDHKVTLERCFEASIKLMGYWYEDTFEATKNRPSPSGQYRLTPYSKEIYRKMVAGILKVKWRRKPTQE